MRSKGREGQGGQGGGELGRLLGPEVEALHGLTRTQAKAGDWQGKTVF